MMEQDSKSDRNRFKGSERKLLLISLFPLLCMVGIVIAKLIQAGSVRSHARTAQEGIENLSVLRQLTSSLQTEKGWGIGNLRTYRDPTTGSYSNYLKQIKITDEAFSRFLFPNIDTMPENMNTKDKVNQYFSVNRPKVINWEISIDENVEIYDKLIDALIVGSENSLKLPEKGQIWKQVRALHFLIRMDSPLIAFTRQMRTTITGTCSFTKQDLFVYAEFREAYDYMLNQAFIWVSTLKESHDTMAPDLVAGHRWLAELQYHPENYRNECLKYPQSERQDLSFPWFADHYWGYRSVVVAGITEEMVLKISEELSLIIKSMENTVLIYLIVLIVIIVMSIALAHVTGRDINNLVIRTVAFTNKTEKYNEEVTKEKEKNFNLLSEMVPRPIAAKLEAGNTVEPELFRSATIAYIDIIGFMKIISTITPSQAAQLMGKLYGMFDETIDKHQLQVYKMETFNDVYCIASGLPDRSQTHVADMAKFLIEIVYNLNNFKISDIKIQVKIGMHTGPCAAGVLASGMKYSIFGQTVKMASRLSKSSQAQRIHISLACKEHLEPLRKYRILKNKEHDFYGIGKVQTFFLTA